MDGPLKLNLKIQTIENSRFYLKLESPEDSFSETWWSTKVDGLRIKKWTVLTLKSFSGSFGVFTSIFWLKAAYEE